MLVILVIIGMMSYLNSTVILIYSFGFSELQKYPSLRFHRDWCQAQTHGVPDQHMPCWPHF